MGTAFKGVEAPVLVPAVGLYQKEDRVTIRQNAGGGGLWTDVMEAAFRIILEDPEAGDDVKERILRGACEGKGRPGWVRGVAAKLAEGAERERMIKPGKFEVSGVFGEGTVEVKDKKDGCFEAEGKVIRDGKEVPLVIEGCVVEHRVKCRLKVS